MKKLGLIVNPIAGMGGSVGLKGTDYCVEEAIRRGAKPQSSNRVKLSLQELTEIKEDIIIYTFSGEMGGFVAEEMGFKTLILGGVQGNSSRKDSIFLAKKLKEKKVDLILFAGGDGTARDVYEAVGTDVVSLGIPSGVKIHSPVYALNPSSSGKLAKNFLKGIVKRTKLEEVLDIDEEEYRKGKIHTKLHGYLTIPFEKKYTQSRKAPSVLSDIAAIDSIAHEIIEEMSEDTYYLIGAGTTTEGIMYHLKLENTLIGVDIIKNRQLVEKDIYGKKILDIIKGKKSKLIMTITGGQGFLFGRGNQQLTPEVIREIGKENIIIIATKQKLAELYGKPLQVDTNDVDLDKYLCGYYKVVVGYREYVVCRVSDK